MWIMSLNCSTRLISQALLHVRKIRLGELEWLIQSHMVSKCQRQTSNSQNSDVRWHATSLLCHNPSQCINRKKKKNLFYWRKTNQKIAILSVSLSLLIILGYKHNPKLLIIYMQNQLVIIFIFTIRKSFVKKKKKRGLCWGLAFFVIWEI